MRNGAGHLESCEQCGAAMERQQRYCVECAARRPAADNPAGRYFATATRRARVVAGRAKAARKSREAPGARGALVMALVMLPIAVGLGVLVGNAGSGGDDSALLAALKSAQASAATTAGPAPASASASSAHTASATGPKAPKAGAKPGSGGAGGGSDNAATGGTDVVAKTDKGVAHRVTGVQATPEAEQQGQQVVNDIAHDSGKSYIETQQGLPDVIVVGGDPGSAPSAPTTPGD